MTLPVLLAYSAFIAVLLAFLIELFHHRLSLSSALSWSARHVSLVLAVSFAPWSVLLLLTTLLDSFMLSFCITALCALLLGYTNYLMLRYREQPFLPRDFIMALNLNRLLTMISPITLFLIILLLGSTFIAGAFLYMFFGPLLFPWKLRVALGFFSLLILLAFCCCGTGNSPIRKVLTACGADFDHYAKTGDFIGSFTSNGFLTAFFSLCMHPLMEPPSTDNTVVITQIANRHSPDAILPTTRKPHVLFIMSEAFSDPTKIQALKLDADPLPHIRKLMQHTPSGQLLTPGYGGGTANCEFEALAGFSNALTGGISPFENGVHKRPGFPSIAWHLRRQGYRTVALHPYKQGMYARTEAYPNMGLERFIDISGMKHLQTLDQNPYVSDAEAYDEVLDMLRETSAPLFLHLVTMQNHGDYVKKGRFQTSFHPQGLHNSKDIISAENYAQGIHYTDIATNSFLTSLEKLDDEVLVVFWGDHLPGAYPPGLLQNNMRLMYETPFFIWSNKVLPYVDLGTRSPMMLSSLLLQTSGLPLRTYDKFLLELQQELHGIHTRFYVNAQDHVIQHQNLSVKGAKLLNELHAIQYEAFRGTLTYDNTALFK